MPDSTATPPAAEPTVTAAATNASQDEPDHRRSAGVVGLAVLASRLFGLARELVFPAMFGGGAVLDAYYAAFQIPNLFRDSFAEGSLSTAFTALFTRTWDREGPPPAWQLANLTLSAMVFVIGVVSVLAIAGAPLIVEATNFGFHNVPGKFELAVQLTRILFPFILFVSLAAAVMGMLNSRYVFAIPASASTAFNIVSVITGVAFAFVFDPTARATWPHPVFTERSAYGVSVGVLLGGLAQLGMQLPALFRLGFRFRWRLELTNPRLRELWSLMWPSVIASGATQLSVLINGVFASEINGGRSWLNCAFRLMYVPIGLFGVSVATVTLPAVARRFARDDLAAFGRTVRSSMRLTLFLSIPAAAGLAALASPVIALIYQHGRWTAHDTYETSLALEAYSIGLAGYAAIRVLTPCFYALNLPRTPLRVNLIGVAVVLVLNFLNMTLFGFGHAGLALATSCVCLVNVGQLSHALSRQVDFGPLREWASFIGRVALAAVACGATAWALNWAIDMHTTSRVVRSLGLFLAVGFSLPVYGVSAYLLRIRETNEALAMVRRRLPRGRR